MREIDVRCAPAQLFDDGVDISEMRPCSRHPLYLSTRVSSTAPAAASLQVELFGEGKQPVCKAADARYRLLSSVAVVKQRRVDIIVTLEGGERRRERR